MTTIMTKYGLKTWKGDPENLQAIELWKLAFDYVPGKTTIVALDTAGNVAEKPANTVSYELRTNEEPEEIKKDKPYKLIILIILLGVLLKKIFKGEK